MYPSPLKGINSTVLSKSQTWMTAATHSEFSIKSNSCLKDIPTSPGLCFDKEKVHNSRFFEQWGYPSLLERCGEDASAERCVDNVCECR